MRKHSEPQEKKWGLDRKFGPATIVNMAQLVTIIWLGSAFYTQTNERFSVIAEQRAIQTAQMQKWQDTTNQLVVQMTALTTRVESQNDFLKDMRDSLRARGR